MYLEYCTTLTVRSFTIVMQKALFKKFLQFSRDGAVVRALVFHQRVPGSIPEPGVIRGWSLLLPSLLCWFFSGYSGFPSPQQSTFPNSNSSLESVPNQCESARYIDTQKSQLLLFLLYFFVYRFHEDIDCLKKYIIRNVNPFSITSVISIYDQVIHFERHVFHMQ